MDARQGDNMTTLFDDDQPKRAITPEAFKAFWNEHRNLPLVVTMNTERRAKLAARCKNALFVEHWQHLIKAMNTDPEYWNGENRTGWKVSIDYLLRNDMNWVRVLEKHPAGQAVEATPKKSKWAIAAEKCEK
jgi:hypothetical protein